MAIHSYKWLHTRWYKKFQTLCQLAIQKFQTLRDTESFEPQKISNLGDHSVITRRHSVIQKFQTLRDTESLKPILNLGDTKFQTLCHLVIQKVSNLVSIGNTKVSNLMSLGDTKSFKPCVIQKVSNHKKFRTLAMQSFKPCVTQWYKVSKLASIGDTN